MLAHYEAHYLDKNEANRVARVHIPDGLDGEKRKEAIEAALKRSRHGYRRTKRIVRLP